MKPWLFLIGAMILLGFLLVRSRERFQPEMLDRSQVARTLATQFSSYEQMTNHMPAPAGYSGRVAGIPTPFRVNQYTASVPV